MECSKISQFYWIHLMILEKTRPCFWTLEPGSRTYGKICLLHPSGPNEVCRPWTPKSSIFYIFHDFTGFFLWFLRKEGPVCEDSSQGSNLWLDTSFGSRWPKQPNVVSRPQAPRSRIFSRFHDFLGFISWLLRKWGSLLGDNVPSS